jgi:hypothetical protein
VIPGILTLAVATFASLPWATDRLQDPSEIPFILSGLSLDLRVDYPRRALHGSATLTMRNIGTRPVARIPLLVNRLMAVSSVKEAGGADLPFTQDVTVFRDDSVRQVTAAIVELPRSITAGDSVTIVVRYGGRLVGYTETGSLYIKDRVDRDFTIIREDAYAFPTLGVAEWRVNRSLRREPFAFVAAITVPVGMVVAAGGSGASSAPRDSLVTWTYRSDRPVPFLNIAIAAYRILDRKGVRVFHFSADSAGAEMVERAAGGAIERFTSWFGPLGEEPRLTIIEIPEGFGSQASLFAGIIETADAFRDRNQLYQLYHELSHLWNAPDRDLATPRWNEGLASFLQWHLAEELDGWQGWDTRLARLEQSVKARCAPPAACSRVPFREYGAAGATDLSYSVGTLMFYLLYHVLGAERFYAAYRDFFQTHRTAGATSDDLERTFTRADARAEGVLKDWFLTTRWRNRLLAGETTREMLERYLRDGTGTPQAEPAATGRRTANSLP